MHAICMKDFPFKTEIKDVISSYVRENLHDGVFLQEYQVLLGMILWNVHLKWDYYKERRG